MPFWHKVISADRHSFNKYINLLKNHAKYLFTVFPLYQLILDYLHLTTHTTSDYLFLKTKGKSKQKPQYIKPKAHTHRHEVHFVLAVYSWGLGLPWCNWYSQWQSLEKTRFSFSSTYQSALVSWLWVELCIHFPFLVMRVCLFQHVWVL